MDNQRNKKWRRVQMYRVFKKRLVRMAAYSWMPIVNDDGTVNRTPHWFELAKVKWAMPYKTTGTPCSCWICRSERYSRTDNKRKTKKMLIDEL